MNISNSSDIGRNHSLPHPNYELTIVYTVSSVGCFLLLVAALLVLSIIQLPTGIFAQRKWAAGVFSFACFATVFQMLSYHDERENLINSWGRILVEVLGILLMIVGTFSFFQRTENHQRPLNYKDRYLASFLFWITLLCIFTMSCLIMAGAFERKEWLSLAGNILAILQKLTQAVLYKARLQKRCAIPEKKIEAIWYLRALSLFNLLMWMNDLINLSEVNDRNLKTLLGQPSNLVSVLYDSLVVEYRLLMSMIFLEHSFDIEFEAPNMNYQGFHNEQRPEHEHFGLHRGMAYIIGVAFFLFKGVNIIQYTSQVGWPNFVAYLTDILLIVLGLIIFVKIKRLLPEDFEEDCSAVDLLLVMMGMFSILYWLFRCCVVGTWAISFTDHHLKNYALWNTVKYGLRIFSTAFLVFIFTNIPRNIPDNNRVVQSSELHFLMPLYLFVLLASYASSIIATYNGQIESWILDLSIGFQILYQAGGPIHLGFSLHVVVHFAYICKALSDEYTRVATEIEVDADDAGD